MQTNGVWEQDPEASILVQKKWEWEVEKTTITNFIVCRVCLIESEWLNLED